MDDCGREDLLGMQMERERSGMAKVVVFESWQADKSYKLSIDGESSFLILIVV